MTRALAIALVALLALWQRDALLGAWYADLGALTQAQAPAAAGSAPGGFAAPSASSP